MDYESKLVKARTEHKGYTPLRSSLLRWFMLLALVPLLLSSLLNYQQTIDRLTTHAVGELEKGGEASRRFIDNWFNNRIMDLSSQVISHRNDELFTALQHQAENGINGENLAGSAAWMSIVDTHEQEFSAFVTQHDYINDLYLVSPDGVILYSVKRDRSLGKSLFEGELAQSRFSATVEKTLKSGEVLFSDLEYYLDNEQWPVGFITSPVQNNSGDIVGVIAIQIQLEQIINVIQSEDDENRYILGEDKYLRTPISELDSSTILRLRIDTIRHEHGTHFEHSHHFTDGHESHYVYMGHSGREVMGVHQEIKLPGVNWLLISEVDRYKALAPARRQGQQHLLILLVTTTLVMLVAIYQARRITSPIIKLADASKAVAEGRLDEQVAVNSNNEIGILADAFNYMNMVRLENELAVEQSSLEVQEALIDLEEQKFALDQHSIVAITDVAGDITFVNDKFVEISGYSRSELLGKNHRILSSGYHDEVFFNEMYDTITTGKVWHGEICNRTKDGRFYWVDTTIIPFMDDFDDPESYIAIRTDITQRKRIEGELIKAKEAAEIATQQKSEFLANMSHEIRTPMNGIIGMAGLLLNTQLSAKQRSFAEAAMNSADALLTIINDILDFSKIEAGKLELEEVPFDLLALAEDVSELMAFKCREKGVDMMLDYVPETKQSVCGDPGRVRQILLNLLSNAIKFTEEGYIVLKVESLSEQAGMITYQVSVKDSGIGIAEEKLDHIFNKFDQEDNSTTRKYGGTGLGLAICKQLCGMMQGDIRVESRKGEGATFSFTMKLARYGNAEREGIFQGVPQLKGRRALVVDDRDISRSILIAQLASLGMSVDAALSGGEAIECLERAVGSGEPFDIVIADDHISDMDIESLATDVSLSGLLSTGVLIAVSSILEQGEDTNLKGLGVDGHLTRPFHPSELPQILSLIWDAKQQGRETPLVTRYTLKAEKSGRNKKPVFNDTQLLLVEDNPINVAVATEILEIYGCKITPAGNGLEALAEITSRSFDLIFMDCQMPEMDGFEATTRIRQYQSDAGSERTPIIAFTANAMKSDQEKCLNAGMDDYVSKPVTQESLENMLKKWLPDKLMMVSTGSNGQQRQRESAGPETAGSDILDLEVFSNLEKLFGDRFAMIVDKHIQNALENTTNVIEAADAGDLGTLERAAHSLKGASGQFGAKQLHKTALEIEVLAKGGELEQAKQLLAQLKHARQQSADAMRKQIGENAAAPA